VRRIDNRFVHEREGDYPGLFADNDLLAPARKIAAQRPAVVEQARAVLAGAKPQAPLWILIVLHGAGFICLQRFGMPVRWQVAGGRWQVAAGLWARPRRFLVVEALFLTNCACAVAA
jgi:hypothetical protein